MEKYNDYTVIEDRIVQLPYLPSTVMVARKKGGRGYRFDVDRHG